MAHSHRRRSARVWLAALAATVAVSTTCDDAPFAPRLTSASFDVESVLLAAQNAAIPVDTFIVELRRTSDSVLVVSDTFAAADLGMPDATGGVLLEVTVPLDTDPQDFYLYVAVIGESTVWYEVTGVVSATASEPTTTPELTPVYVGPGADGTRLVLSPADTTITGGDSLLVTGTVFRDQTAIAGAPVTFASSNETLVPAPTQVGRNQAWLFAPGAATNSVTITATAPTAGNPLTASGTLSFFAPPDQLVLVSGDGQTVDPGQPAPLPLVVQVLDAAGQPFSRGYDVTFAVTAGPPGTAVDPPTATADETGLAQTSLTAGDGTGTITVTADAQGLTGSPVTFTATLIDVSGPAQITINAGDGQSATVATAVAVAPSVLVQDVASQPVPDVEVTFAVASGGGSITGAVATTDAGGIATVGSWTLGQASGANTLTATVAALQPVTFTATGIPDSPQALNIVSGDGQSADAGTALPNPLVVEAVDRYGNGVPGTTVSWTVSHGSVTPTSSQTDAVGQAQTSWTLGTGTQDQTATATVTGLTPVVFQATAVFQNPTILLELIGANRIAVGGTADLQVTLSAPAGPDGVSVAVTADNPAVVGVQAPGTVSIPPDGTTGQIGLDGLSSGTTTVRGNAAGYIEGTLAVEVSPLVLSLPTTVNVPFGGTASIPVQISTPAPEGGEDVTLVSTDPSVVEVLTPTVTIPEGGQTINATVSGVFPGTVTVTGTSAIYGSAQSTVSTTANLNIVQASVTINATFGSDIQIRLESAGSPIAAPAGGIAVTLSAADPTCAVATSPVTIPAGQVEVTSTLTYGGSATLPCNTTVTANAPDITPDNMTVNVNPAPGINVFNTTATGSGLMRFQSGSLAASNHGGVTLRLASADPQVLLLSPDAATQGTPFIDIPMNNGVTSFSYFTHGLEGATGTITITASAPGFTDGTNTVNIVQPALEISALNPNTTTLSPDDPFLVRVGIAAGTPPNQCMNVEEAVRAGAPPLTVAVTNDSAAVAQLVTTPDTGQSVTVQIQPGSARSPTNVANGGAAFDPLAAGATTVTAVASGYIPLPNASIDMTVTAPGITVFNTTATGSGLMRFQSGSLGASNHGGVTVRLTSADPQVLLLSPNAATQGTPFIDIPVNDGSTGISYYTHGLEGATGTITITASAPGFTDGTNTVNIVQPALEIIALNPTTTTLSPDDPFLVRVGIPAGTPPNQFMNLEEQVRAGAAPLTVTVTNDSAAVARLVTTPDTGQSVTVQIQPGSARSPNVVSTGGVAFDPLTAGATTVTAAASGYILLPNASIDMTVTAPGITVFNPTATGSGLMRFQSGSLGASNHGGVTLRLTSADPQVLLLSPDAATEGTPFIDIPISDGSTSFSYYTHGLEGTTGTITITASAPGFTDGTNTVNIVQPALEIIALNPNTTTLSPDDPFLVRVGIPAGTPPNQFMNVEEAVRAGAPPLTVAVDNSAPGVAQLVTTATTGESVIVQIQPGSARSPNVVSSGGVAFDPLTAGATTVTAAASGYIALPNASIDVTVSAPGITVFNTTATGSGLMRFQSGSLGASNHGGVTVRLTSSDPQVLLLSPTSATEGTPFIDIPMNDGSVSFSYYTHGLEGATGTVVVTAEATGFVDGSNSAEVVQPAFELINLSTNTTAGAADDPFQIRIGVPNATNSFLNVEEAVRVGAQPLTVTVDNSDATVAQLVTTTTTGQSLTVEIQPGATRSPSTVANGGIAFDALAAGSTTVAGAIPGFVALPRAALVVTVSP